MIKASVTDNNVLTGVRPSVKRLVNKGEQAKERKDKVKEETEDVLYYARNRLRSST